MTATLITGASSGIGSALAEVAAERGIDVVLVARRADRLHDLADRLAAGHGVRTLVIASDLAEPGAARRIHGDLASQGWQVDTLVNAAGLSCDGRFLDVTWTEHQHMLRVLIEAPGELIHCFLPAMLERGAGHVINVASVGGLVPGSPWETLYGPAKQLLVGFTRTLAEEYRGRGVGFTVVCPGVTRTEMLENGIGRELLRATPGIMVATPREVAEATWRGADAGRTVVVPGLANRVMVGALRCVPSNVAMRVLTRSISRLAHDAAGHP